MRKIIFFITRGGILCQINGKVSRSKLDAHCFLKCLERKENIKCVDCVWDEGREEGGSVDKFFQIVLLSFCFFFVVEGR